MWFTDQKNTVSFTTPESTFSTREVRSMRMYHYIGSLMRSIFGRRRHDYTIGLYTGEEYMNRKSQGTAATRSQTKSVAKYSKRIFRSSYTIMECSLMKGRKHRTIISSATN